MTNNQGLVTDHDSEDRYGNPPYDKSLTAAL